MFLIPSHYAILNPEQGRESRQFGRCGIIWKCAEAMPTGTKLEPKYQNGFLRLLDLSLSC
jgi:hypothetical protein